MSQTLITTKLSVPRGRSNVVARPHLLEVLGANDGRKLTLVSAPAGFGKTTLLVAWLQESPGNVAWLSLDAADNDLGRFLTYLVGALRGVKAGIGEGVLDALRGPQFPPTETLVGLLINDTAALAQDVTLVLDDYHVIDTRAIHEAVTFFLEHLPENARVVISSRADPPLPLARLRARGQLVELGAADLRFTLDESCAFLGDVMGLTLSSGDVATLEGITEGWVAALQLAALGMQGQADVSSFVRAFSGSNRHVLDFLAEEVLERQPEHVRSFLLHTSVLGRFCAPLCAALVGSADAQEMLEGLEHVNLFVVPLDDERRWYRYHHLFADFLRSRLMREHPGLVGELHLRASGWFEEAGLNGEAITYALAASASGADPTYQRAARILEVESEYALASGEGATILAWLGALPEGAKRQRPRLLLEHAVVLAITGQPDAAEPLLDETERLAETAKAERRHLLGSAAAIRCYTARLRGDVQQAVALGKQALELLPDEISTNRSFAAICLGEALRASGELAAAGEACAEGVAHWRVMDHFYGMLTGTVWEARVLVEQGRLREVEGALRQALQDVTERGAGALPAAGLVHLGLGALHYEQNALGAAERELTRGLALFGRTREVISLTWGYLTFSRLKWAQGEAEEALEFAHRAERLAREVGANFEATLATIWTARLHLAQGDTGPATVFEQTFTKDENLVTEVSWQVAQAVIRLYRYKGHYERALYLLEKLCSAAEAAGRTGGLIEALTLQALTLWSDGKKEQALRAITRALMLAEPEGFVRTFVDEGAEMRELLLRVLETRQRGHLDVTSHVSTHYLAKLLAALGETHAPPTSNEQLPEPLTERELEVLALIAAGRSNKAIAATLSVSLSTVKTHINNLYGKLEVRSRTQALAQARETGLL
jgi:LuxR family transcriptional regulator, maltose regulon positive regulatory protein